MAKEKKVKDESLSPSPPNNGATDGEEHVDAQSISDTLLAQIESKIASGALRLPDKDWVRSLEYRKSDNKGRPHELKTPIMVRAAWGQATGLEVPRASWCRSCASGSGTFASCVIADDGKRLLAQGACMNCFYHGHQVRCSFVDENGSTPRFILNHAMKLGTSASATTPKAATETSPSQKRKVASVSIASARVTCPFAESVIFEVPATPSKAQKSSKTTTPKSATKSARKSKDADNYDDIDDLAVLFAALGELEDDVAALKLRIKKLQLEKNVEEV
ncbi:hypothetical protein N7474_007529 [Penicillium riverlandense]|uniref:uncharacterized protein n=1 Tax=Penicillium riverlandense TaxID=1903569 RepID=UPI00254663B6|nr:uncharacterized protein N7474_007529 [Penicillium riverlandense]KAJ5815752.1 hypothetical protein N7474_007529 [Penicillium riverlandense]